MNTKFFQQINQTVSECGKSLGKDVMHCNPPSRFWTGSEVSQVPTCSRTRWASRRVRRFPPDSSQVPVAGQAAVQRVSGSGGRRVRCALKQCLSGGESFLRSLFSTKSERKGQG